MSQKEALRAILSTLSPIAADASSSVDDAERIRNLIEAPGRTGLSTFDLREITNSLVLETAIGRNNQNWADILSAVLACLPAGADILPFSNSAWVEALRHAQYYAATRTYMFSNARIEAVAAAGERLYRAGYKIDVEEDHYSFRTGELERATATIRSNLEQLGPADALGNIFRSIKLTYDFDYGIYLTARRYKVGDGKRDPTIPFAFMLNLAVGTLFPLRPSEHPGRLWEESVYLARDVVAALNVEPYFNLTYQLGISVPQILKIVREVALYDHLFTLRQWRFGFTKFMVAHFFEDAFNEGTQKALGWSLDDVVELCKATEHFATSDPNLITRQALQTAGIAKGTLSKMLTFFSHSQGSANAKYDSPLAATMGYDILFKPFIKHGPNHLLLSAATLLGPAFYEATMNAIRPIIGSTAANNLVGAGTERVSRAIFLNSGMNVSHSSSKYRMGSDNGECDLVLEDENCVVFVECKANALTRATMSGISEEALLDFAGGVFAAQRQALRHEIVIKTHQQIRFEDGSDLKLAGRAVYRLALTLLDQGALQDRMLFRSLFQALSAASIQADTSHRKFKQVSEFNEALDGLRSEIKRLESLGVAAEHQTRNSAALSLGQLEACIDEFSGDLSRFCRGIFIPMTYGALNPLAELHHACPLTA